MSHNQSQKYKPLNPIQRLEISKRVNPLRPGGASFYLPNNLNYSKYHKEIFCINIEKIRFICSCSSFSHRKYSSPLVFLLERGPESQLLLVAGLLLWRILQVEGWCLDVSPAILYVWKHQVLQI